MSSLFVSPGRPLRRVGNCSFVASMPVALIFGTATPPRMDAWTIAEGLGRELAVAPPVLESDRSGWLDG